MQRGVSSPNFVKIHTHGSVDIYIILDERFDDIGDDFEIFTCAGYVEVRQASAVDAVLQAYSGNC